MLKRRGLALAVAALALLTLPWTSAHAGIFVSVGVPGPFYGPYYHRHYYYYGPRVVVAAPVVVAPAAAAGHGVRATADRHLPAGARPTNSRPDHHGLAAGNGGAAPAHPRTGAVADRRGPDKTRTDAMPPKAAPLGAFSFPRPPPDAP